MKRIAIFLALTFGITYAYEFLVVYPLAEGASASPEASLVLTAAIGAVMVVPAICVLLTRLITKEGFKGSLIKPVRFKRTFKYYLIAWFGTPLLITLGAVVYFLIFPGDFDPSMSALTAVLEAQVGAEGIAAMGGPGAAAMLSMVQLLVSIFLAPLLNFVTCFGEEWGWRGYLLPKVNEKLSFIPTILVTGVIWGLWHAPITALGHNYGLGYAGWPFLGIFAMCCFCTVIGTFFSYLTIKAGSCLPAVIGHGALNGFASAATMFTVVGGGNPFIGPMPVGLIGGSAFIVVAVIICITMRKQSGTWSQPEELRPEAGQFAATQHEAGQYAVAQHETGVVE